MVLVKINYASVSPIIKITYDETPVYIKTSVNNVYAKVVYGTSIKWGDIEGTLSDQTDLQNALDDKVPYTGATANVDLGEYELKAGQLTLDVSPTGTAKHNTYQSCIPSGKDKWRTRAEVGGGICTSQ